MNITLFNKKYWARRFGEQKIVRGYATSGRTDFVVSLNVHPLGTDQQLALPEGERRIKRLEAHGTDGLIVANQSTGVKGDLLYYHGYWYECIDAQEWDHTVLSHINYQFVIVPDDIAGTIDLSDAPKTDPNEKQDGYEQYQIDLSPATATTVGGVKIKKSGGLRIDSEGYLYIDNATAEEVAALFGGG